MFHPTLDATIIFKYVEATAYNSLDSHPPGLFVDIKAHIPPSLLDTKLKNYPIFLEFWKFGSGVD